MTLAFKIEGVNYNTKAADIVIRVIFMSTQCLPVLPCFQTDAQGSFVTVESAYLFLHHLLTSRNRGIFPMFVDVEHQL